MRGRGPDGLGGAAGLGRPLLRRTGAVGLAAALAVIAAAEPAAADDGASSGAVMRVSVTVPALFPAPSDDEFVVGPFDSHLAVLANDRGPVDRGSIRLVADDGLAVRNLAAGPWARLSAEAGAVLLSHRKRGTGHVSFRYATRANAGAVLASVSVRLYADVLVVEHDRAATGAGTPVVVDVGANDRLVVDGAETPCGPQLFAHPPVAAHQVPLVLPEPARTPVTCAAPDVLSTKDGSWTVRADGKVLFEPADGFRGTATAYYRQTSEHPFDLGDGQVSIEVGRSRTVVLGEEHGPRGSSGGLHGGPIPRTGALVAEALVLGLVLVLAGSRLRRRRPLVR